MSRSRRGWDQPGLFELGPGAPLPRPKTAPAADGPARWSYYREKARRQCEDCAQVAYEAAMVGDFSAPQIRAATRLRTVGTQRRYLCTEHGEQRKADEPTN